MFRFLSFIFIFLMVFPPVAEAENKALIVGVSEYPSLPETLWLDGPKNDAEMVRSFLENNSAINFSGNVTVLADGVEGAQTPTREAIIGEIKKIALDAQKDDFIYLHFSGHGSRQPVSQTDENETDGMDEMFLPYDIGTWNDEIGQVENALVDNELGALINDIRAKGAFVWAVFDSCHSGTLLRSASHGEHVKMREVGTELLGIPDVMGHTLTRSAQTSPLPDIGKMLDKVGNEPDLGGFVAFYAAQTTEQTPEMRLPAGKKGRKPHGLFSYTLLEVLSDTPNITYRQAAQEILKRYDAQYMDKPTPLFEGNLDKAVFGQTLEGAAHQNNQWRLNITPDTHELSLDAGYINRLDAETILAVLHAPTDTTDNALGYIKITDAGNLRSQAAFVEYNGMAIPDLEGLPETLYARLVRRHYDFTLKVLMPEKTAHLGKVLESLAENAEGIAPNLAFVQKAEDADITLLEEDNQIWFIPKTGLFAKEGANKTPSVTLEGKDDNALRFALMDNLSRIARATNLLKVSQDMSSEKARIETTLFVKKQGEDDLQAVPKDSIAEFRGGDEIHIEARNINDYPLDVNVLFIGSDYSISHWFSGRIHPQDALKKGLFQIDTKSVGTEKLLVVATKADNETLVQDLSFLAQEAMPQTRTHEMRPDHTDIFAAALFGIPDVTRGLSVPAPDNSTYDTHIDEILIRTAH